MPREQPQPLWGTSAKPGLYVLRKAARDMFHRLLVHHVSQAVAYCCRADDAHCSRAGLLCLESSHNRCGGTVLSLDYMSRAKQWADEIGIPVHLDGARVFNAAESLGVSVREIASHVTSVQFCLSKVQSIFICTFCTLPYQQDPVLPLHPAGARVFDAALGVSMKEVASRVTSAVPGMIWTCMLKCSYVLDNMKLLVPV